MAHLFGLLRFVLHGTAGVFDVLTETFRGIAGRYAQPQDEKSQSDPGKSLRHHCTFCSYFGGLRLHPDRVMAGRVND